ncbi:hypothetical protein GOP47_0016845 [Adiantum capillus-veneris]|uniref:DNA-directed RNA polymerase I subunit rpa49 n=1 Tax=Adiantum capillus-veneris TaxID=13818 RepID=A0A9D4ZCH4_ADICA|nr:hypothetical protein GOP47_0016845 [Adiantum capillus-veneris]
MEEAPHSPNHSRKRKKRKKMDVSLDFVPAKEGHACPFVGYFPSGFDPLQFKQEHETQSEQEDPGRLKVSAYQNTEKYKTRQHQVVVTPPDTTLDFVGTNYLGEGAMWQPGNYVLGVFDKESLTLQLLPLSGTKVLRMEPRVRGLDYDVDSLSGVTDVEMSKEMMLQKRNLLTATFGTHKSRIKQSRYERSRVKEEALGDKEEIGRFFQKAGDNASVLTTEEALQQANAAVKRNIPPYDLSATTPERAYIFDKIITLEEQNSLNDIELLKAAIGKEEKISQLREEKAYPEFVLKRLYIMKNIEEERQNRGVMILSYMRHLLAFYNLPKHAIHSIVDPMGSHGNLESSNAIDLRSYAHIPDAVVAKILKRFTTVHRDKASRTQSAEKRDLLISYIIVLGLMVDNFHADPYDLAVEMKKSISALKRYYMELGCKFKTVKEADRGVVDLKSPQRLYEAVLPLPLQFPMLKNKLRRKI